MLLSNRDTGDQKIAYSISRFGEAESFVQRSCRPFIGQSGFQASGVYFPNGGPLGGIRPRRYDHADIRDLRHQEGVLTTVHEIAPGPI
jgi:hypothetical protein